MEVGVLRRIQPQPFRRNKPTPAVGAVDGTGGFQLRQAFPYGDTSSRENGAQLTFGRQLIARLQRAASDTRL
ncbi:hypothetical protein D3C72_2007450 [compost metagenome]